MADTTSFLSMKPKKTNSPKKTPVSSRIPAPDDFIPEEEIKRVMFAAKAKTLGKGKRVAPGLSKPKSAAKTKPAPAPKPALKRTPKPEMKASSSTPQPLVVEDLYPDLDLDNISEDGIDIGIFHYPEEEKKRTSDFIFFPKQYLENDYGKTTYLVHDVPVNSSAEAARSFTRCPILGRFLDGSSTDPTTESLDLISAIDQREAQLNIIRPELQKIEEINTELKSFCERIKEGKEHLGFEVDSAKCLWSAAETRFEDASLTLAEYERFLEKNASNEGTFNDIEAIRKRAEIHKTGTETVFSDNWNTFFGLSQNIHSVYEKNIQIEKMRSELQLAIKLERMVLSTNTPDDLGDFEALEEFIDNSAKHPALSAEWGSMSEDLVETVEEVEKLEAGLKKENLKVELVEVKEPKWATPMRSQSDLLSTKRDEVCALLRNCVILLKRRPQLRKELIDTKLSVSNLRKELKLAEVMAEHFNAEADVFESSCCLNPYSKIKYVNAGDSSKQHAYERVTNDYYTGLFKKVNVHDDQKDEAKLKMSRMTLDQAMEAGLASNVALFNTSETSRSANSLLKRRIRECKADNHLAFEQAKNMKIVLSKLREQVAESCQVRKENNEARQIKDEVAVREHNVKVGKPFMVALKQRKATLTIQKEVLVLKSQPVGEDKPCTWGEPAHIPDYCAGKTPKVEMAPKSADFINQLYATPKPKNIQLHSKKPSKAAVQDETTCQIATDDIRKLTMVLKESKMILNDVILDNPSKKVDFLDKQLASNVVEKIENLSKESDSFDISDIETLDELEQASDSEVNSTLEDLRDVKEQVEGLKNLIFESRIILKHVMATGNQKLDKKIVNMAKDLHNDISGMGIGMHPKDYDYLSLTL